MGQPINFDDVVELLEAYLLGSEPTLTGQQLADALNIDIEVARSRWRSLGFTAVPTDEVAFTDADLVAMRHTQRLQELGFLGEDEDAMVRSLGSAFSRLAEWQLQLLSASVDPGTMSLDQMAEVVTEIVPIIEEIQNYVWRRHVVNAAARLLLVPDAADTALPQAIGFADIVGYTRQSRSLSRSQLARLVESFEAQSSAIIAHFGGRLIKTIGDEVLFAADSMTSAAKICLLLAHRHEHDAHFPQVRVGAAWGPVMIRVGDVFGPVVNIAARLTSLARPGTVLVDAELAHGLETSPDLFSLRRLRRTSVRGYRRLEPWALRWNNEPTWGPELTRMLTTWAELPDSTDSATSTTTSTSTAESNREQASADAAAVSPAQMASEASDTAASIASQS